MNTKEFIKKYKEKDLIRSINYEGDLIISKRQLEKMLEEYAQEQVKLFATPDVSNRYSKKNIDNAYDKGFIDGVNSYNNIL